MSKNLFAEYVEMSTKNIYKYLKFIFKENYDEQIANIYVQKYIDSRYYNLLYKESSRIFYLRIKEALAKEMNKLLGKNKDEKNRTEDYVRFRKKEKIIKDMYTCFDYIFFFDRVRNIESMKRITSIEEVVDKLYERRENEYEIKTRPGNKEKFLSLVKDSMDEAERFLDRYFADKTFELAIKKHNSAKYLYNVELVSNVKIPMIYSKEAIDMAFNSEDIKEERLPAEYLLLSLLVLRDIVEINFKDEYLVEITPSILTKKKKCLKILQIINDPELQDKINLKITYRDFLKYKEEIFELIKEGYNFALILDDEFQDEKEIQKLQMFSYIIVGKHLKCYKKIAKIYNKKDKIIYE